MKEVGFFELVEAMWWAISGNGNLPVNRAIRQLNSILFESYDITRKQSFNDFKSYFYDNKLHLKFDNSKSNIRTYTCNCARTYLQKKVRKHIKKKQIFQSFDKLCEEGQDPTNDFMKRGDDGVWRVASEMVRAKDDIMPTNPPDPEKAMMLDQVKSTIEKFFKDYDPIYYDVYAGNISTIEAGKKQGVSQQAFYKRWKQIKDKLVQHLIDKDYDLTEW